MVCDSIKFTVVSDPPEEEEQDEECEDVGVAYLRILDIMDKRRDVRDVSLSGKSLLCITQSAHNPRF